LFTKEGFYKKEVRSWKGEDGELWQRHQIIFPEIIPAHSRKQVFYFDRKGFLVRHDYVAEAYTSLFLSKAAATRYCMEYKNISGFGFR